MKTKTKTLTVKEDILYGDYTVKKGTIVGFTKKDDNIEIEFTHEGKSYKIGNYIILSPSAGINGNSLNKDEITTLIVYAVVLQNENKEVVKVKCNCICHKEGRNVKHIIPCCNNGYKNKLI